MVFNTQTYLRIMSQLFGVAACLLSLWIFDT